MLKCIKITFPVKKKNRDDTYKTMAQYEELGDARYYPLIYESSTQTIFYAAVVTKFQDLIWG